MIRTEPADSPTPTHAPSEQGEKTQAGVVRWSPHPLQRSGAWAAALLRGREHPEELTDGDLDRLVERIAGDCERAGRLEKGEPGWAWLVRLAGMYPQSPPTHPRRRKISSSIGGRVAAFLGPDPDPAAVEADGGRVWPCKCCQAPGASLRWGKDRYPLSDSAQHLNVSVYGGGYPLCRGCRVAFWTLPYGTATTRDHLHQTVDTFDDDVARAVAAANLEVAERALAERWTSWRQGPCAEDVLWDVLADRPDAGPVQLLHWNHGNRESHLSFLTLTERHVRRLADLHHRGEAGALRAAARRTAVGAHPLTLAACRDSWTPDEDQPGPRAASLLRRLDPEVPLDPAVSPPTTTETP